MWLAINTGIATAIVLFVGTLFGEIIGFWAIPLGIALGLLLGEYLKRVTKRKS